MTHSPTRRRGGSPPLLPLPAAALALLLLLPAALLAQAPPPAGRELAKHVYTFKHQPAKEASALLMPLLSAHGSLELRPGNTLVITDTLPALERILPVLHAFDHPVRDVDVELWLIRASGGPRIPVSPAPPPAPSNIPPDLLRSLLPHFAYRQYELVSQSRVRSREGQRVTFELAGDFAVRFRVGTMLGGRLRLGSFEVQQVVARQPSTLLKANLNLFLGRNTVVGLAGDRESPTALLVVVRCRPATREGG